jgi:kynurenine formamidase
MFESKDIGKRDISNGVKIIDLSLPIDETNPEAHPIRIDRLAHKKGIEHLNWIMMRKSIGGIISYLFGKRIIKPADLPQEEFLSLEMILCSVHTGTHVDAPYHFGTKCETGDAKKIDDLPLDWFFSDGVVLDLTSKRPGQAITRQDLEDTLLKINYKLKPKDIVLLHTGADKYFGSREYMTKFCGVSPSAIEWLLDEGIKVIGIFKVVCFPVRIKDAGASFARVAAILEN